jgi:hypothetical protein
MPIEGNAEKIQLMLETMGIEGINAAELAYDKLEKQVGEVEQASRLLQKQTQESKSATYDLIETEYKLVEAVTAETKALEALLPQRMGAAQALDKTVTPATENAALSLEKLGRGTLAAEKAVNALATGTGLIRLGPALEGLTKIIGGPAGLGFAIGSMAVAVEGLIPHFLKWINADNAKHAKEIADALQKQADAADQLAQRPTKKEAERIADIKEFLTETPGLGQGGFRQRIEQAIRKDPNAMLTPDEIRQLQMQGGPGSEAMVRRRNEMIRRQQEERITAEVNRVSGFAPSDQAARLRAIELAETHPEFFGRTDLAGALRRAQAGEQIGPTAVKKQREEKVAADNLARKLAQDKDLKDAKEAQKARDETTDANNLAAKWGKEVDEKAAKEAAKVEADRIKGNNDAARVTRQVEEKKAAEEKRRKAHEAREAARARTPAGKRRAQEEWVGQQIEAIDQNWQAQGGQPATEEFKRAATHQAIQNIAGNTGESIAQDIWFAVAETKKKIMEDTGRALRGLAGQGAGTAEKVNGNRMVNPPGMWR